MLTTLTRTLLLISATSLWLLPLVAHSRHDDPGAKAIFAELEANRRLIVEENMNLTAVAEPDFWAVYDSYRLEISDLEAQGFRLLSEFRDHFEDLTDARANDVMSTYFELEQKTLAVRAAYINKFNAVISAKQTLRFYQIENKLDSIIQADVSAVTPLVP